MDKLDLMVLRKMTWCEKYLIKFGVLEEETLMQINILFSLHPSTKCRALHRDW